jgi:hypothetical protein
MINQCIPNQRHTMPINGLPYPWGVPYDYELERLRAMERRVLVEDEKRRIRERLWAMGIYPYTALPIPGSCPWVVLPALPGPPGLEDVIGTIR